MPTSVPTSATRRLLAALAVVACVLGLSFSVAGAQTPATDPTAETTTADTGPDGSAPADTTNGSTTDDSTSITDELLPTPTPEVEGDGFEPVDVIDWIKDNIAIVIVAVGVVLLVALWKWASRPARTKF